MTFTTDPPIVGDIDLIPGQDEKADLDAPSGSGGKLLIGQAPNITITETSVVADAAERLALDVQEGDVAIQTNVSSSFIFTGGDNVATNWQTLDFDAVGAIDGEDINPRDITPRNITASGNISLQDLTVSGAFNGADTSAAAAGEALTSDGSGGFSFAAAGGNLLSGIPYSELVDIRTAFKIISASQTAMEQVIQSQIQMEQMVGSQIAMEEVAPSQIAMQEVGDSEVTLDEIITVDTALAELSKSDIANAEIMSFPMTTFENTSRFNTISSTLENSGLFTKEVYDDGGIGTTNDRTGNNIVLIDSATQVDELTITPEHTGGFSSGPRDPVSGQHIYFGGYSSLHTDSFNDDRIQGREFTPN